MMFKQYEIIKYLFLLAISPVLIFTKTSELNAQILSEGSLETADVQRLQQDLSVFTTIQRGITLSVAECELSETCSASVNRGELEQLITTVDGRVNSLSLRYTESGDAGLENILVGYADVRDSYRLLLDKMATLPQFASQQAISSDLEGDDFFTSGTGRVNRISDDLMQLFQDADEELVDDALDEETTPENVE